jgi:hypothetical protein
MERDKMQASVTTTQGLERRLVVAVPGEQVAGVVDQPSSGWPAPRA